MRTALAIICLSSANISYAEEKRAPSPWKSEIEVGYQALDGNTDYQSLNSRVEVVHTRSQYRQTTEARFILAKEDGEEEKRKGQLKYQGDMKINERTYVLGNANYVDDRYGAYFVDFSISSGLGYQLVRAETLQMEVEAGPGYRHQEPNIDEIDDDDIIVPENVGEAILRTSASLTWRPRKTVEFSTELTSIIGNSNSTFDADFNVTNHLNDNIALKLSSSQRYNSWVPEGLKNRDSAVKVNILFML